MGRFIETVFYKVIHKLPKPNYTEVIKQVEENGLPYCTYSLAKLLLTCLRRLVWVKWWPLGSIFLVNYRCSKSAALLATVTTTLSHASPIGITRSLNQIHVKVIKHIKKRDMLRFYVITLTHLLYFIL